MSYSTDKAKLLADQLGRFVTLSPHQLAGQVANLDFWLGEVRQALRALDDYGVRFVRLHAAQEHFVARHQVTFAGFGEAGEGKQGMPQARRVPDRALRQARRDLVEAVRRFLERCVVEELISASTGSTVLEEFAR